MPGTVLLIEDEESIATLVTAYLERDGFRARWVRSGQEGLEAVERESPRLVILDIGLPDMDGFEVCRQIRRKRSVPIVMLTARDDEIDRVTGLEVGADDYVSKPFSPRELIARVRAVLRRTEPDSEAEMIVLGDVVLNRSSREVMVGDRDVDLRGKEFDLLAYLMENRGAVVTRDMLLDRVWGLEYAAGTRTVDVHVAQLRKKLGRPELIRTVRGTGYKLIRP